MGKLKRISRENAIIFSNVLRSGAFKQGRGSLQSKEGHCCLGVACEIFMPEADKDRCEINGHLDGFLPEHSQRKAPDWLKNLNGDVCHKIDEGLSDLNDSYKYTFDEIADVIELLYVHKALR